MIFNSSKYITYSFPESLLPNDASPEWNNKADNAWQLTAATLVGLQSVPGLVILYGSMVKKKWAVNSAFMGLYAFSAVLVCWVLWAHEMAFGNKLLPFVGKPSFALNEKFLLSKASTTYYLPMADFVFYQFAFAAITLVLLAGSLLGRMNFYAWMLFVPMWLTLSYTVGAFTIWGNGFLEGKIIDYAGGFVIHLSSGVAGFTAAYWVGPRSSNDRKNFPPNNIIHMLGGAGFLWMGWTGFNGDMLVYKKGSLIGSVQGMITGLVCITPGAGLVDPWAAILMGALSGSIPWYTMMVLHKRSSFFQSVDDTLGVFHTHAVAGILGGILSGVFAKPNLLKVLYGPKTSYGPGLFYSYFDGNVSEGIKQMLYQLLGAFFITLWNVVITSLVCIIVSLIMDLRMQEEDLEVGDDAAHGEEAYVLWGDGEKRSLPLRIHINSPTIISISHQRHSIPINKIDG
ncbi:hypothetical protein RYX36_025362 [Vicia faba]